MKRIRCLMAVLLVVIVVGGIVFVKGPDTSGLKAPSVAIWLVGITNRGRVDEHACFMVSNSSPFAVIAREIYAIQARTAAGESLTNFHFFDNPQALEPQKTQPIIGHFWVTRNQTSWRSEITYQRVESDWEKVSRKLRFTLYLWGIPVDPIPTHESVPTRESVIYTDWLSE